MLFKALMVLLFIPGLIFRIIALDYSPSLKNNDELDRFMALLSNRYKIKLPQSSNCKPMHVDEVMAFLCVADSLDSLNKLTKYESYRLKSVKKRICAEKNIYSWKSSKFKTENYLNLSVRGLIHPYYQDSVSIHWKGIINPKFSGRIGKRMSYFSEVNVWTEQQTDTVYLNHGYEPYNGNPYNLFNRADSGNIRTSDMFRGGLSYRGNLVDMETAVDHIKLGPAVFYPLTFSGIFSPMTYCKARVNMDKIHYTQIFGLLKTQKNRSKYFYVHRVDISMFRDRAILGFNEVIVNGSTAEKAQTDSLKEEYYGEERTLEWLYMIPFVPYSFAEFYNGDKDNVIVSFDFNLSLPKEFRWYFEFFIDDFSSPATIFSDDFSNKWALTVGGQFFGVLLKKNVTLSLEYSRVEPWVYTHFYGGSHRYSHYGHSLGNPLGPNSDVFVAVCEYAIGLKSTIGFAFSNVRKNEMARGGSIRHVFGFHSDSEKKVFLGDDYRRITTGSVFWKYAPFGLFSVNTELHYNSDEKIGLKVYGGFSF